MSNYELKMPRLGESITEATITRWLKEIGAHIEVEEPILEIATDKVDTEILSPVEGTLKEQHFQEGETVVVDNVIAIIETASGKSGKSDPAEAYSEGAEKKASPGEAVDPHHKPSQEQDEWQQLPFIEAIDQQTTSKTGSNEHDRFYSPLVKSIAKEEGLSIKELDSIKGSGKNGRLTKEDLIKYLKSGERKSVASPSVAASSKQGVEDPLTYPTDEDEIIVMDRVRKLIAQHMVRSEATSVHITLFAEADMTKLVHWRNQQKEILKKRENENLTFTPIFIEAIAKALRDYPMVNISVEEDKIIKRKNINIGMATSLPNGNLIVPVIRDADHKSLIGLAREVNDLANRARNNQLKPDEIQDGTFTLTNFGSFGTQSGTPIIHQPQVAILGVGLIEKKPAVIETPQGDAIAIRHKMILSFSCDHRVIDGALGSQFLITIKEHLENFDTNQNI